MLRRRKQRLKSTKLLKTSRKRQMRAQRAERRKNMLSHLTCMIFKKPNFLKPSVDWLSQRSHCFESELLNVKGRSYVTNENVVWPLGCQVRMVEKVVPQVARIKVLLMHPADPREKVQVLVSRVMERHPPSFKVKVVRTNSKRQMSRESRIEKMRGHGMKTSHLKTLVSSISYCFL